MLGRQHGAVGSVANYRILTLYKGVAITHPNIWLLYKGGPMLLRSLTCEVRNLYDYTKYIIFKKVGRNLRFCEVQTQKNNFN